MNTWVCLKIVYPYTQWLMIIIPTKWPIIGGIPHFQTYPHLDTYETHCIYSSAPSVPLPLPVQGQPEPPAPPVLPVSPLRLALLWQLELHLRRCPAKMGIVGQLKLAINIYILIWHASSSVRNSPKFYESISVLVVYLCISRDHYRSM